MFHTWLDRYGIAIPSDQEALFEKFLELFLAKNQVVNLSAIRDADGVYEKHFIDSLIVNRLFPLYGRVLDIGSGGGFPGIPLAITHPHCEFVLLDSIGKKTVAMREFVEALGLQGVISVQARAEQLGQEDMYHGEFDWVVSRATAYLPRLIEWSVPFLRRKGSMLLYKLPSEEELAEGQAMARRYGRTIETIPYVLAGQERVILKL